MYYVKESHLGKTKCPLHFMYKPDTHYTMRRMHTIMHFHEQNGLKRQISLLWGGGGEAVVKLDLIVVAKGLG